MNALPAQGDVIIIIEADNPCIWWQVYSQTASTFKFRNLDTSSGNILYGCTVEGERTSTIQSDTNCIYLTQQDILQNDFQSVVANFKNCNALDDNRIRLLFRKYLGRIEVNQAILINAQGGIIWAESSISGNRISFHETETWTPARLPLLQAVIMHEMIHLIGEQHNGPTRIMILFFTKQSCAIRHRCHRK